MLRMYFGQVIIIIFGISYEISLPQTSVSATSRTRRTLIFPPTTPTRVQFICGIGIPVEDLHYESITSGYVLKAEYFLPTNATELHKNYLKPQTIHRRRRMNGNSLENGNNRIVAEKTQNQSKRKNELSKYRWILYKTIEQLSDRMGLVGRTCVLKCICETAKIPFYKASGVLAEIVHIIMTPSSSVDVINKHSDNEYLKAEMLGRAGADCANIFTECKQSFIEQFSTLLNIRSYIL